jgi:hypothetical protein
MGLRPATASALYVGFVLLFVPDRQFLFRIAKCLVIEVFTDHDKMATHIIAFVSKHTE